MMTLRCRKCGQLYQADPWVDDIDTCAVCCSTAEQEREKIVDNAMDDIDEVAVVAIDEVEPYVSPASMMPHSTPERPHDSVPEFRLQGDNVVRAKEVVKQFILHHLPLSLLTTLKTSSSLPLFSKVLYVGVWIRKRNRRFVYIASAVSIVLLLIIALWMFGGSSGKQSPSSRHTQQTRSNASARDNDKLISQAGVDVNARDRNGLTAIHKAAFRGDISYMQILLDKGARLDIRGNDGQTVVHAAVVGDSVAAMQWLKDNGMDLNAQDDRGWTPAFVAASNGNASALQWLLDNGVNQDFRNRSGSTAVHIAAANGKISTLQVLKDNGANLDIRDNVGMTVVHKAVGEDGSIPVLQWLKNNGANIFARDNDGWTPMHAAAGDGSVEILRWFKSNGADLSLRTSDGLTVVDIARAGNNSSVLQWLRNNM